MIDPRRDVDDYLRLARENDLSIAFVLETHRQEDFEFGSRTLAQMTGAKIVGGSHALFGETDVKLEDEQELKVGTTRFVALATPGHTPESMSYAVYVEDSGDKCWGVFTGDALFVGDTGRTDLPDPEKTGENAGILYDAIHRKIAPLGEHTLLFPAHGAGSACGGNISERDDSTLGIEKATNPVFRKSRRDFVAHKLAEKMARPPYFLHLEKVNLLPGRPLKSPLAARVLQPREFQQRMREGVVIDTRSPEAFAAAHIPGAYNIWLDGLPAFGGWVANENTRIFLIADGAEAMDLAVMSLARIGIDSVEGTLAKGIESWRDQGLPLESIATTSAPETANWVQQGRVQVLDVRDEYEWDEKHIPGALHRYVGHLEDQLPLLPKDSEIVVHCNVGHRSGVAASILKRNGFTRIHNMLGGICAWEKLGLPLEKPGETKKAD
ncbi:rhodanese-like domain-containing protein [Thauera sp.]|uniref:rhodanese-like domain-containing protein n=1 Tax=Thauera sp. TaxID=1905334 RepID=UPI002A369298|nr:rhodanese-like domain-containing protein [Thauera sp.]MDX9886340.1 rhodanese-like domain-containing protein [Thauera sp.]